MPLKFTKRVIAARSFESVGVFDVDGDGVLDIVSGSFWYQGPDFTARHFIGDVMRVDEYYDDFSTIPLDINGDGWMDFITGGWWGGTLRWRENPGVGKGDWPEHVIAECGNVETTRTWDVDGDGALEIVPNTPGAPFIVYKLVTDSQGHGTGKFSHHLIDQSPMEHGLGCGDIAGNGKMDFVVRNGWYEAPTNTWKESWIFHQDFDLGSTSVPIIVTDLNDNGLGDLIVGMAHGYGLYWYEQRRHPDGTRTWVRHSIDPYNSQYHDLHWVDLDSDGENELVTGKRYRAHNGRDPGAFDDLGIYYFKWDGETFSKQFIAHGPEGTGASLGIYSWVGDLRGVGMMDVVAAGKDGLKIFYNEGM